MSIDAEIIRLFILLSLLALAAGVAYIERSTRQCDGRILPDVKTKTPMPNTKPPRAKVAGSNPPPPTRPRPPPPPAPPPKVKPMAKVAGRLEITITAKKTHDN